MTSSATPAGIAASTRPMLSSSFSAGTMTVTDKPHTYVDALAAARRLAIKAMMLTTLTTTVSARHTQVSG